MGNIYYNGNIITMTDIETVEAVYEKNGIIEFVGDIEDIKKISNNEDNWINLDGMTLIPSFIDSHSHITALASTLNLCNLSEAKNFDDIVSLINKFKNEMKIKQNEWIICFGYDNNFLEEKKHPDKLLLDIFESNPVLLSHSSGHMGVLNSLAMELMNIDNTTEVPKGGKIGKFDNSNELNGYFEETAFINISSKLPQPTFEQKVQSFKKAEDIYFRNGITTVQDGLVGENDFNFLKDMSEQNIIDIDLIVYTDLKNYPDIPLKNNNFLNNYINNLKIGGYKIFLDGSPQGKTAYLREPYENSDNYRGYPIYKNEELIKFFEKAINDDIQIIAHSNGDAASEQYIESYKKALENLGDIKTNIRPVLIHGQLLGLDQLEDIKNYDIIPSFFVSHVYHWGDIHKINFGNRAENISPLKSALDNDILFTIHTDTPVIPPNIIEAIWIAVNRITKNGEILGDNQKIAPYDALKSVTYNAAYQYFEEDKKGSIEKGKFADFVILDKNLLDSSEYSKKNIKDVKILKTIKRGKVVFDINNEL